MNFVVLGSLAVEGDRPVAVRGPQLRRLLAMLVLHADEVVSVDRLADAVFDGAPSSAAATTLRSYVARLRRLLEDDGTDVAIVTEQPGYRLHLGDSTIDAQLFEDALGRAESQLADQRSSDAIETLEGALAMWRGPAFSEFDDEEWARLEATRLDGRRIDASEMRLVALVDNGRHEEAITELEAFVDEHPMRTAGWSTLMLALYRSGRQAEALRVATRHRNVLRDVGLEPTPEIASLEAHIATDDPAIRTAAPSTRKLRGYELFESLGGGRRGVVHAARQPGVDRDVALRLFGADVADLPDFVRDFDRRVVRAAAIEHPYLVPVLDFWREPGLAALVTRLLSGDSLADTIEKGPAPIDLVAGVVEQVAGALLAAHRAGVVHGVLTPGDVLFDGDGNAYVDGVGIDAAIDDLLGLPPPTAYAPPEIARSPAGDQYHLAAIAYHVLTGFTPFGASRGVPTFPRLSEARPELLALDGVLARAGAPSADDRYPDVGTFAASFSTAIGRRHGVPPVVRAAAPNPYKGLRAFEEEDAERFFGRDRAVAELLAALREAGSDEPLITLVGPSGSGKSSVVRAGLLPHVRSGALDGSQEWFVTTMVPTEDPFGALAEALATVASSSTSPAIAPDRPSSLADAIVDQFPRRTRLLVVIDQMEELFTLVTDDRLRSAFIDQLCDTLRDERIDLRVVATLRADLYDLPLSHHRLGELVARRTVPLAAMTPAELERAIVEPATAIGVEIEGAIVAEILAAGVDRPGMLPLLQFCLTELYDNRAGDAVTLADYERLGGIDGAVAERAERIYASLTPVEQVATRHLMLRLVEFVADTTEVRRRVTRRELTGFAHDAPIDRVLDRLGDARLLSFDRDPVTREQTVEVAHEALMRSWPRLRDWLAAEGADLRVRSALTVAAHAWERGGRDAGDLYRGARLSVAEEYAEARGDEVTDVERHFLERSVSARDDELNVQRRSNRRLRVALAGVAGVLLIAALLGALAFVQRDRARDETARAERAVARTLASSAVEQLPSDRSGALLLAIEANRADDTTFTRRALMTALTAAPPFSRTTIETPASDYTAMAVNTDETVVAAKRGNGEIDVIDLTSGSVRHASIPSPARVDQGLAFDPDGRLVVSAGEPADGVAATVIDVDSGAVVAEIPGEPSSFHEARFIPPGDRLAVGSPDGMVRFYDTESWDVVAAVDLGEERTITTMEPSADGTSLYVAATPLEGMSPLAPANMYVIDTGSAELASGPHRLDADIVTDAALSPEIGVVFITADIAVQALDLDDFAPIVDDFGESAFGGYNSIAVSPEGLVVAVSPVDFDVFAPSVTPMGEIEGWTPIEVTDPPTASAIAFIDGGRRLVAADPAGLISVIRAGWIDDVGTLVDPPGPGLVTVDPTGDTLAIWGRMRGVQLYDRATLDHTGSLAIEPDRSLVGVGFDADGKRIVTMTCPFDADPCPTELSVWDVDAGRPIAGPVDAGDVWAGASLGAAFTGDGQMVATAGSTGVQLWDARSLEPIGERLALDDVATFAGDDVRALATGSADERSLLVANGGLGEAVVWELTDGDVRPIGFIDAGVSDVGFAPDGLLIVAQGPGTVQFHDPFTLQPVGAPFVSDVPAFAFRFSQAGTMVSTGTFGSVVWDIASREPLTGMIPSSFADVSPDGKIVYLGAAGFPEIPSGAVVRALSLERDDIVEEACRQAGRNLTRDEWDRQLPEDADYGPTCPEWPMPDTG